MFLLALLAPALPHKASAGLFGEHKHIGDAAFRKAVAASGREQYLIDSIGMRLFGTPTTLVPYKRNPELIDEYRTNLSVIRRPDSLFAFTYGDLSGMAGDHSIDVDQLLAGLLEPVLPTTTTENILTTQAQKNPVKEFENLQKTALARIREHVTNLDAGGNGADSYEPSYMWLGLIDKSHFAMPKRTIEEHLSDILPLRSLLHRYIGHKDDLRPELIDSLFLKPNLTKYAVLHLIALELSEQAGNDILVAPLHDIAVKEFLEAIWVNAFADHFLQDAFAAGHLAVIRGYWNGLDNKGTHDYYNRCGLDVHSDFDSAGWRAYGDNYYTATPKQYQYAIAADSLSIAEVLGAFFSTIEGIRSHTYRPVFLLEKIVKPNSTDVPATLVSAIGAYRYIPRPLTEAFYNEYVRFADSRNGLVVAISGFDEREGDSWSQGVTADLGFQYAIVSAAKDDRTHESYVSVGLDAGWSALVGSGLIVRDWRAGVSTRLYDQFVFDARYAIVRIGNSDWEPGFAPAIGYEFKPVEWSIAPSIRIEPFYSEIAPMYRISISLSYY